MAEKPQTKANFPTPPPFYQHFTKDNINKLRQIRKEQGTSQPDPEETRASETKDVDISTLPQDLRYLIPPPPPADGKWRTFGAHHDLHAPDPSLEEAGIEVLFPSDPSVKLNPQPYLLSLARSTLTTFLALTGTLAEDPTQYQDRITDLTTIVTNMHHLINQYRPHQARETLILMMEERIEKLRGEIKAIGEAGERMDGVFKGLQESGKGDRAEEMNGVTEKDCKQDADVSGKEKQRTAWEALQAASLEDEEET